MPTYIVNEADANVHIRTYMYTHFLSVCMLTFRSRIFVDAM